MSAFPIKVLYDITEKTTFTLKAGVTVSSRNFKKAVQRNRVKRVLREAFRLQKLPLQTELASRKKSLVLFFIYTGKELPVYKEVFGKMGIVLQRLQESIKNEEKV